MTLPLESFGRPLRILHVDDDEDDYLIIRELLAEIADIDFDAEWVSDYDEALDILVRHEHDLCLLDYYLGEHNGLELFNEAVERGIQVPCVMLTGTGNREVDLNAMISGVSYYIDKNRMDVYDLERAIRYSLEHARILHLVEEVNAQLEERVAERTHLLRAAKEQLELEMAERDRLENELRELRFERQRQALEHISRHPRTTISARLLGVQALEETEPHTFNQLVERYDKLLDLALNQLSYKVDYNISEQLRALADFMCSLRLSPRDVVAIHNAVLKSKAGITPQKADGYIEEGRLMILELMGYMVSYYRNFASGTGDIGLPSQDDL